MRKPNGYNCPLLEMEIDETICYDIQMVTGPGRLINKSILDDYSTLFDITKVSDIRVALFCTHCSFNQLKQPAVNGERCDDARKQTALAV